jgi:hypothetical protein
MFNDANAARAGDKSYTAPILFTMLVVAFGVFLYATCGVEILIIHCLQAPFAIFMFWMTWNASPYNARYARDAQSMQSAPTPRLREANAH